MVWCLEMLYAVVNVQSNSLSPCEQRFLPCMASRLTSDANSHARGEPLLAGLLSLRCLQVSFLVNTSKRSVNSGRINRLISKI